MKKTALLVLLIFILFIYPICGMSSTTMRMIYVDDTNTSGPWDGSIEHPYQHIQDGIDASIDGDSVFVFNGTYREILSISRSITLQGENPEITVIDAMAEGNAIAVLSDYVSIYGFTITNTTYFLYAEYKGIILSHVNHCMISRNIFFSTDGIHLYNSSDSMITNNTFHRNYYCVLLSKSTDNTITGNSMYDNSCCISLGISLNTMITGNIMKDNYCGVFLGDSSYNNMIIGNIISNSEIGIELSASGNTIAGNIIGNSSMGGIWMYTSNTNISDNVFYSNGITMWGDTEEEWTTHIIENNIINGKPIRYYKYNDNVKVPFDTAQVILAHCTNSIIQNLSLSTVDAGIQVGFSTKIFISGNLITNNNGFAIKLTSSSDIRIEGNIIDNNFLGIAASLSSEITINANTITNSSYFGDGITLSYSSNTIITGNTIYNNYYGLSLFYSSKNMITRNTLIDNNASGICLEQDSSDNIIKENTIQGNKEYGIYVYDAQHNNITNNNFVMNTKQVYFIDSYFNVWSGNYWDDWISSFPRLIWGKKQVHFPPFFIPWINIDWHPVQEPYDIP